MPGCDSEPMVNNAKAVLVGDNETVKVTYECLTGFYMSGQPRLVCNRSVNTWGTPPTCHVIYQESNLYNYNNIPATVEVWWYYLLAAVLGSIALLLLVAIIWCCCCTKTSAVYPSTGDNPNGSCCRSFYCGHKPTKVKQDKTGHGQQHDRRVKSSNSEIQNSTSPVDSSGYLNNSNIACSPDGQSHSTNGNNRTAEPSKQTVVGIASKDSHVSRSGESVKESGGKNKIWLPHTHGVRNNKTSTK